MAWLLGEALRTAVEQKTGRERWSATFSTLTRNFVSPTAASQKRPVVQRRRHTNHAKNVMMTGCCTWTSPISVTANFALSSDGVRSCGSTPVTTLACPRRDV